MRKIALALSKGGVGKTTSAVNLAAGLAEYGRRVLLVDMDTQGQVARSLGVEPPAGLAAIVEGQAEPLSTIFEARPALDLLSGGRALAGVERLIIRQDFGGERTVAEALQSLDERYDYVIIDTSPGWDTLTINALFYAQEVMAPVALEVMALQGLTEFAQSLASIQKYHPDLSFRYVLPTFMDRRVKKSAEILGQLEAYFPEQLCQPIRYNVRLSEAPGYGQTIFEYAPRSAGAEDYRHLVERMIKDE